MNIKQEISLDKSILFIPVLMTAGITIIGIVLINLYFTRTAIKRYEEDLKRLATAGVQMLHFMDKHVNPVDFDSFANSFARGGHFRVTIIDANGEVLGDSRLSKSSVAKIENHSDRPEILQARESGLGISKRYSTTLKIDLLYVALLYSSYGREGFFRVALPLVDLKEDLARQRMVFSVFGLIALIAFSVLSLILSRYLLYLVKKNEGVLEARVNQRTKQLETLQGIGTQLTICQTKSEGLDVLQQGASSLLPQCEGALSLFRSSKDKVEIVRTWNGEWQGAASYLPEECWALRTGRAYLGNPGAEKLLCGHSKDCRKKMLCIPISAQGENYGTLHFATDLPYEWTEGDYRLAYSLAEHASLALANLELRENLKYQAIRDPLTGLFNRRFFIETFENELNRAVRRDQNLGLLMMDLDHFKQFNDTYGHGAGDFILSEFGSIIQKVIRSEDTPCRYGGEEFVILLPETDLAGACSVAGKIGKTVKEYKFISGLQSYGKVTLSIGVACFPEHGEDIEMMLQAADKALYRAKKMGRDQVVSA